jgi:formate hydrogenlyase subunit 4
VDDPATHLELTMIHEVMVLDHSGPDFGFIEMGPSSSCFSTPIVSRLIFPFERDIRRFNLALFSLGVLIVYVPVGVVESVMARYRMDLVPKFVLTSFALAFFATVITLEFLK